MDRFTGFLRPPDDIRWEERGKNAALELPVLWQQDLRFTSRARFVLSAAFEIPKRPRLGKQCPVTGGIVVALRQETPMPILSCGSQRAHLLGLRPAVWRGRHHVVNVSIRQNAAVLSGFSKCFLFFFFHQALARAARGRGASTRSPFQIKHAGERGSAMIATGRRAR